MELRQLNTLVAVCREHTFTRAAERLGCTQANVTLQIQQLERELGTKLFERLGRKVSLTAAGATLLRHAEGIIKSVDEATAAARNACGTLVIGSAESLCTYRLPAMLGKYRARHPDVQIVIKMLGCAEYLPSLESNAVDVLLALGEEIDSPHCRVVSSTREPVSVCAHPDHPLAKRKRVSAKDFDGQAVLLTGEGCCYRGAFLTKLGAEYVHPQIVMETNSIQAIKQAAINGVGLCVLPDVAVRDDIASGALARLPYEDIEWGIVSQILHHKDKWLSPALAGFLELA